MTADAVRMLLSRLGADGDTARFVGGCVRDTVVGREVGDIDLATEVPPGRVMALLDGRGIRTIPTGLAHGTVTAVVDGAVYEITTLRRDVETDGRRATVAFTDDWRGDAARRDFTINALYLDADGTLYDPTGGLDDLRAGRVRFIGAPRERLEEDVLRLLRFFRFHARYGKGAPDAAAMAACRDFAPRLPGLSGERVWAELRRILAVPDPGNALRLMDEADVLRRIVPGAAALDRLDRIAGIETELGLDPSAIRRLAAVLAPEVSDIDGLARELRLSRAESVRLEKAVRRSAELIASPDPSSIGERLYRWSETTFGDALAVAWADCRSKGGDESVFERHARALTAWSRLVFPVGGEDAIALGAEPGPPIGRALAETEAWWIGEGFAPGRDACLVRLAAALERAETS